MRKLRFATGASISVVLAVAAAAATVMGSCSSDKKDESDLRGLCTRACLKKKECAGSLAGPVDCNAECNKPAIVNPATCTNAAAIIAKSNECLAKPACAEFAVCADTIPDCGTVGGTSGAGGTGGRTTVPGAGGSGGGIPGFGGISGIPGTDGGITIPGFDGGIIIPGFDAGIFDAGGATCEECAKAQRCSAGVLPDAGAGSDYVSRCNMATGQMRDAVIVGCRLVTMFLPNCQ